MIGMNYEQALALSILLPRIDDGERGTLIIEKTGVGGDLTVRFDDATFEISAGGTTERLT